MQTLKSGPRTASWIRRGLLPAFLLSLSAPPAAEALTPPLGSLLLLDRFQVSATWRTADGSTGRGTGVALTRETGHFWFFSPTNVEVVVKVLDACADPSHRFWVFAGGLTDVEVELAVTDLETGEAKVYRNPRGTPFEPIQDTNAFATCDVAPRCGQGTTAELAATPRADGMLETLALFMGDRIAAPQALYDRVVADVTAIRAAEPANWLDFAPRYDPQGLIVELTPEAADQLRAGTYHAWDCLNDRYDVTVEALSFVPRTVILDFRGRLEQQKVRLDYAALPGIARVDLNYYLTVATPLPGTGGFCGWADGDTFYYFARFPQPARYYTSLPGQAPVARGPFAGNAAVEALAARCYQEHSIG